MKLEKLREIASKRSLGEFYLHYSTLAVQYANESYEPTVADSNLVTAAINHIDALLDLMEATINMIRTHYIIQGNRAGKTTITQAYAQIEDALAKLEAVE